MQPSSTSTKLDKATARKLANRESAKNSYLKKKEYVKNLENENAELKEEVKRLREVGKRMRKAMVAMQEKQLLLEDVGVGGLDNHVSRTSSPSIVKLATIPIIAISSTLCYVDNTSQLEPARLGGAMSMVGSSIVSVNFLVLIGLVAVVCMYFMFDFDKIKEQRKSIGVKRRLFGKYWAVMEKGGKSSVGLPYKSAAATE
ncbi:hypothetical protein TrRE_jg8421 [Triparma retinervis]|uniref:BZIP domain-containing protein n=1 Tax=Triparma retinervis TaxID=2557542 RepID=A0A9W7E784_9STRA|nr:hypothetical protein TrRE_jg8421 [Triparma retinervis]